LPEGFGIDGLLGLSFLRHFNYEIRSAEGRISADRIPSSGWHSQVRTIEDIIEKLVERWRRAGIELERGASDEATGGTDLTSTTIQTLGGSLVRRSRES
jgi:hypothetical protein